MPIGRTILLLTGFLLTGCSQGAEDVQSTNEALHNQPNPVFTLEHDVHVSHGATLHVIEKFSAKSVQGRRRGILALSGTLVSCDQYNVDVDGYNVLDRLAQHGYFAFCATYEGYPGSSTPADGNDVTKGRLLDEMGDIVEWARHSRNLGRMDTFGASLGSSLAFKLGGVGSSINRHHIRRVVLTANVYKAFSPQVAPIFQGLFALFHTIPGGYFTTDASFYAPLVGDAPQNVLDWIANDWPGTYAVGPTLAGEVLPPFQAADGRAPSLQILGDEDPITPLTDAQEFQAEYGGPHELFQLANAGHSPYFNPGKEVFWAKVFDFLDDGNDTYDCDD